MNTLLVKMPCQSVSKEFKKKEIHETLFDKRVDRRYLESSVQRFINLNEQMFEFLGVGVELKGTDNDLSLSFRTSNLIGAIPMRMPYDGLAHKDFQITPRFDNGKDVYSELTELLSRLEHSIKPEYSEIDLLCAPMQLKPPTYYEAIKFIDYFEKAYKYAWVKFDTKERTHSYPKASTDWSKHAIASSDPKNALLFPSHDSVLTTNHKEWQQLKYVFEIAKEQVVNSTVPSSIRFRYQSLIENISNKVSEINSLPVSEVVIRASDPKCIKDAKTQANIILKKASDKCSAWRMDMAELFERYAQHIVLRGTRELSGTVISNGKITGKGSIPSWGLRYLEPDIIVKVGKCIYVADAKYKSNFYNLEKNSDVLKETHRSDLHQLLAYCSFEPQKEKTGILFYPAQKTQYKEINYTDRIGGICNKVILCGLEFGVEEMESAISKIKTLFQSSILTA